MAARSLATALLLATMALQAQAGTVEVRFIEPERFIDAGDSVRARDDVTRALAAHLQRLGQRLPAAQLLRVDLLDIDLAGTVKHGVRGDVRVLRGGADWPRLRLRYTWLDGDRTLAAGEETLADLDYFTPPARPEPAGRWPYEERLLTRWFEARFGGAQAQ